MKRYVVPGHTRCSTITPVVSQSEQTVLIPTVGHTADTACRRRTHAGNMWSLQQHSVTTPPKHASPILTEYKKGSNGPFSRTPKEITRSHGAQHLARNPPKRKLWIKQCVSPSFGINFTEEKKEK